MSYVIGFLKLRIVTNQLENEKEAQVSARRKGIGRNVLK